MYICFPVIQLKHRIQIIIIIISLQLTLYLLLYNIVNASMSLKSTYRRVFFSRVNAVSDNIIVITCAIWPQRENCAVPNKNLFGSMVHHMSLSKIMHYSIHMCIHIFV